MHPLKRSLNRPNLNVLSWLAAVALLLPACGDKSSTASGSASASAAASSGQSASGSASAPAASTVKAEAAPGPVTSGEVESSDKKTKIGFSLELPEGIKDVSDVPYIKQYAKEKGKYDGYSVTVGTAKESLAKAGMAEILKEAEKEKANVLQKEEREDGWHIASQIDVKGKKAVIVFAVVKKGDAALMCKVSVEGELGGQPDVSVPVAVKACRSLKITAP